MLSANTTYQKTNMFSPVNSASHKHNAGKNNFAAKKSVWQLVIGIALFVIPTCLLAFGTGIFAF